MRNHKNLRLIIPDTVNSSEIVQYSAKYINKLQEGDIIDDEVKTDVVHP